MSQAASERYKKAKNEYSRKKYEEERNIKN